jgi:hypothetical protein
VRGPDTAQRVHEILTMNETWNARAPGRLHLEMEDADGAGTRIRLAMRGSELAGRVDLSDPAMAARMRERIGELHEALSRQGIDARALEARALTGVEGRGAADGDLASLLKDPLAGLARVMDAREGASQSRGEEQRNSRQESQRGHERFQRGPDRDQNKENQR